MSGVEQRSVSGVGPQSNAAERITGRFKYCVDKARGDTVTTI